MKYFSLITIAIITLLSSCGSDGSTIEEQQHKVSGVINIDNHKYWPENQIIKFAIFKTGTSFPLESVTLTKGNSPSFELTDIKSGTYTFKIFVLNSRNKIRSVLASFENIPVDNDKTLETKTIDLIAYSRVQEQIFNNCLVCHGASAVVAANLDLHSDKSFNQLKNNTSVNKSKSGESFKLIEPNHADKSLLVKVLINDVNFDHSEGNRTIALEGSQASEDDINLIINWINEGAKN